MAAKVLLVEDDNNLREIYQARLSAEGYDIVAAQDGEEALVSAKKEHPDLIISDVMMPRISGFEMLDILRNTDELKNTKVIMLTALGQAEDQARADNLGADKYLVKSQVTLEDIVKCAQELLGETPEAPAEAPVLVSPVEEAISQPAVAPTSLPEPVIPAPAAVVPEPTPVVEEPMSVIPAPAEPVAEPGVQPSLVTTIQSVPITVAPIDSTTLATMTGVDESADSSVSPAPMTMPLPVPEPVIPAPAAVVPEPTPVVEEPMSVIPAPAEPVVTEAASEPTEPINPETASQTANTPEAATQAMGVTEASPQSTEAEEAEIEKQIDNYAVAPASPSPEVAPYTEPPEAANDTAAIDAANDAVIADAVEQLDASIVQPTPALIETAPVINPVTETPTTPDVVTASEVAPPPLPTTPNDSVIVNGKKIIRPLSDTTTAGPTLEELLAKEAAKDTISPPASVVTGQTTVTQAPQSFDPNSISL